MAPTLTDDKKKDKGQPDGARPGAENGDTPRGPHYAFDADARAKLREDAPITIGGVEYFRRRKNWEATRAVRRHLRDQEKSGSRVRRLTARMDRLTESIRGVRDPDTGDWKIPPAEDDAQVADLEEQIEALEAQIDERMDESDESAFGIIVTMLRDKEGNPPAVEHLKGALDIEEAGELATNLAGGGETDPLPTSPSS